MRGIKRSQLVNMNQHYRRFSMDFFLDCQQRLGIGQIELWCGAAHFWLDHTGYDDVSASEVKLRPQLRPPGGVGHRPQHCLPVPVCRPGARPPGVLLSIFSNAIHLAAELGPADRWVNSS